MYFIKCEKCGANLDPGEKCDCTEKRTKKEKEQENIGKYICSKESGQVYLSKEFYKGKKEF